MIKKSVITLLIGAICLLGATALAYNEAPMLRVKVAAGELPSVEERLPEEPSVLLEPLEEIGQYGGTLHVFTLDNLPWGDLGDEPERGTYLGRFVRPEMRVEGDLAKGFNLSDDEKSLTIYLRKGVKWSDGAPFTADDILFMFEDMHLNDKVSTWGAGFSVKRVTKIDDYTVSMEFDEPSPVVLLQMAMWIGSDWKMFQPKHYLRKWHIKYNPKADELAKEEGFDNWWDAFTYHFFWVPINDIDKPTLQPWVLKQFTSTTRVWERNPYYWKVDKAGNQLPYVDRIVSTITDSEVYQLKIMSGEADIAYNYTSLENYPLYKENEDEGGYRTILIPGFKGSQVILGINQTYPDPEMRKIYQDVRFRQALSLAINREEINETVFFGIGVPRQATVVPSVSYYKEEWAEAHAQYNLNEANRLLDEVGLTERDQRGFRIGPDGKSMLLPVEYSLQDRMTICVLELVKEYWEAVGLEVLLKPEQSSFFGERMKANDHVILANELRFCTEIFAYTEDYWATKRAGDVWWCPAWTKWLAAEEDVRTGIRKMEDFEGGKLPGEEPPQSIKDLQMWENMSQTYRMGSKEYIELRQKIHDWHATNLVIIGTVGLTPQIYIAKRNIGNVPEAFGPEMGWIGDLGYYAEQLFYKR